MKLLVLGAGGIGGYFGGRLAESGADVTFLVRPSRREQLDRDGLRVDSPLGNIRLAARTILARDLRAGYDLILLTCKAYDLDASLEDIAPAMGGACAVVPLLNGLAHFDRLDQRFGAANVMGGTCAINVTLGKDGVIHHADQLQRLQFGERDRSVSSRARALADTLASTRVDWELSDDIELSLWESFVFLSALAATTCMFRANVGEILSSPGGPDAMERALATNVEIAVREGRTPRAPAAIFARSRLLDPAGSWSASMLRDLEAGGPIESDHIVGWMLDKARAHGIDAPILSLAYTHLKAYESRRIAGRLPAPR